MRARRGTLRIGQLDNIGRTLLPGPTALWARAALIGAFLLVLEGYLIGFAHFTQFQSLVVLFSALVMLVLVSQLERSQPTRGSFILLALLASGGLLAHYDGAAVALPGGALLAWLLVRHRDTWVRWRRALARFAARWDDPGDLLRPIFAPSAIPGDL